MNIKMVSGNEAAAFGAIRAGCRFYAGYPITPSSEIMENMAKELPKVCGRFIQMEDEISSMAAIIGASLTGEKSMTATSGPGFSLMQENLGLGIMGEVPCVVVDVQRGGPSTGLPTRVAQADVMQARWGTHGDHEIIALYPSTIQETYELMIDAFNLSELYRTPVVFIMDEVLAHVREKLVIPENVTIVERPKPKVEPKDYKPYDRKFGDIPPLANFGSGYKYHVTGLVHDETGFPTDNPKIASALIKRLNTKISKNSSKIIQTKTFMTDDAEILFISYGSSARSAKEAVLKLREEGIKVGSLQLLTIWPFPGEIINQVSKKVKKVYLIEMNMGQLYSETRNAIDNNIPLFKINRVDGELITPNEIANRVEEE